MGAQIRIEGDVARLLELADQTGGVEQGALDRHRVRGLGAQIAVAAAVRGEQRLATAQVENQIGLELPTLLPAAHAQPVARGYGHRLQALHLDRERAQMAAGRQHGPRQNRELVTARRQEPAQVGQQQGNAQTVGELPGGAHRQLAVAEHDAAALRTRGHRCTGRHEHRGFGQQRRDLRRR